MNNDEKIHLIQEDVNELVDKLMVDGLQDIHSVTEVNNRMRYGMLRIINLKMSEAAQDPKMITAWKALIKDIDAAVFMLARLAQEDRHLDNEEMVAQALNAVSEQVRRNPYRLKEGEESYGAPELPTLPETDFDKRDGVLDIGLINTDYETFMKNADKAAIGAHDEEEEDKPKANRDANRDAPLPPPVPGQL